MTEQEARDIYHQGEEEAVVSKFMEIRGVRHSFTESR